LARTLCFISKENNSGNRELKPEGDFSICRKYRRKNSVEYLLENEIVPMTGCAVTAVCRRFSSSLGANIASYSLTGLSSGSIAEKKGEERDKH